MEDCIFCKIANGVFGSATVYEDDDFRAVLDIAPAAKGHVLILPKKHMPDLLAVDPDVAKKIVGVASKIANAQRSEEHTSELQSHA